MRSAREIDVDEVIKTAYRYLDLRPEETMRMTPKEFHLLMDAKQEKVYDEMEMMALEAMMMRAAYHAKKLKQYELFDRQKVEQKHKDPEDMKEKLHRQQEWLNSLKIGKGEEHGE
ncbi:MAG TPA: phage tail assembly chaperone [Balneolaceae bacterium]|nr:phage tail assembly chaperone [Balneolaceae bacterium]